MGSWRASPGEKLRDACEMLAAAEAVGDAESVAQARQRIAFVHEDRRRLSTKNARAVASIP
jgi:hypothetical protein